MALSWGSGRLAYWLGSPILLPVQRGAPAAWLLSLFIHNWQVQACGSCLCLPRCLPPWTRRVVPTHVPSSCHLYGGVVVSLSEVPHRFAKISPETGVLALLRIDTFSFLWGHGSHPAVASSQLVPHTYRPGTMLTGDLVILSAGQPHTICTGLSLAFLAVCSDVES